MFGCFLVLNFLRISLRVKETSGKSEKVKKFMYGSYQGAFSPDNDNDTNIIDRAVLKNRADTDSEMCIKIY